MDGGDQQQASKKMEARQDRITQNNKGELKTVGKFLEVYWQDSNVFILIFHKMALASVYKEEKPQRQEGPGKPPASLNSGDEDLKRRRDPQSC